MLLGMSNYIKVNNFGKIKKKQNPSSVQYFFPTLKKNFLKSAFLFHTLKPT